MLELIFISGEEGAALFPLNFLPPLLFDFETGRDQVPEEIKAAAAAAAATAIVAFFILLLSRVLAFLPLLCFYLSIPPFIGNCHYRSHCNSLSHFKNFVDFLNQYLNSKLGLISCKHSVRWRYLSWMKDRLFCFIKNNIEELKTQQTNDWWSLISICST